GEGRVRHLSFAHFGAARLRELQRLAASEGLTPIRTALAEYNLMHRAEVEKELVPAAQEAGVSLLARLPLASGFLSGEVRSKTDLPANPLFDGALEHVGRKGFRVLEVLGQIAALRGTTSASVALAWLLGRTGVTAAIVRINNLAALADSMSGASFTLTRHESLLLDEASA
ncbi:MAG TPA: aldo/keto reductase, partial [Pseudolysinimonas sp.]|nr:aldo/keto reductase [Pseudolysinimonas sp.]